MKLKVSAKFILIVLIITILLLIILIEIVVKLHQILTHQKKENSWVNIVQNQPNGEKIKIIADLMEENKKEKLIKLINPITEIIKKNNITKITSNYGYIIDNYSKFKLNKDVNIYNNEKKFLLKTEELSGTFDTGDMFTNSPVQIQINNSKIQGSSLNLKNYGEYIKVFGKVILTID